MKIDTVNPTLSRIYTTNENIKGMLHYLKSIMDSRGYQELYTRYMEIAKEVPENEVLTEYEKIYGSFGTDLKYTSLDAKLRDFEKELDIYNEYKEFSDLLNEIKSDNTKVFMEDAPVNELVDKDKQFIDLLIELKNNKTIHQFTGLINDAIQTLFTSMKTLTLVDNDELVGYVRETNSDFLKEHLVSAIRNSIDTTSYKGRLDDDYVDLETIHECAMSDSKILARQKEARDYAERQIALANARDERIAYLQGKFKEIEENIKKYKKELSKLKIGRASLFARKLFLKSVVIPAIAIPLSCPFIGRHIGKEESSKVELTRTITNTVDAESLELISTQSKFEELRTNYIASVTICKPWKKSITGASYTRDCTVYDYDFSGLGELPDDYHLTLENIDPSKLIEKYTYNEPTSEVKNKKYLTEEQVYITETYQDLNEIEISTKYNLPYTVAGAGVGVLIGTTEVIAYLYAVKEISEQLKRIIDDALEENENDTKETNKTLKLVLDNQTNAKAEYNSLTKEK